MGVDPDTVYFQHTASDDPILLEKVDTLVLAMGINQIPSWKQRSRAMPANYR